PTHSNFQGIPFATQTLGLPSGTQRQGKATERLDQLRAQLQRVFDQILLAELIKVFPVPPAFHRLYLGPRVGKVFLIKKFYLWARANNEKEILSLFEAGYDQLRPGLDLQIHGAKYHGLQFIKTENSLTISATSLEDIPRTVVRLNLGPRMRRRIQDWIQVIS